MTNAINTKATAIKILLLLVINLSFACSNNKNKIPNGINQNVHTIKKSGDSLTVNKATQTISHVANGYKQQSKKTIKILPLTGSFARANKIIPIFMLLNKKYKK